MAFALTAKDNIGSGIAILIAMVVRVVPMKLGYAQILSKSGLSYLQEHLFTTLATSVILIGAFIGLLADLEPYKAEIKVYFVLEQFTVMSNPINPKQPNFLDDQN